MYGRVSLEAEWVRDNLVRNFDVFVATQPLALPPDQTIWALLDALEETGTGHQSVLSRFAKLSPNSTNGR
jgi:hypothetical protein